MFKSDGKEIGKQLAKVVEQERTCVILDIKSKASKEMVTRGIFFAK